jgi:hypothetical protein
MEQLIEVHKSDVHEIARKIKKYGMQPPAYIVAFTEKVGGRYVAMELAIELLLEINTRSHSEMLSEVFGDTIKQKRGDVGVSHIAFTLPVISATYTMDDDEWVEFHAKKYKDELTKEEWEKWMDDTKIAYVCVHIGRTGMVVTSMTMPAKGEVEFLDTNIQPFEGGSYDRNEVRCTLARILDERLHLVDKVMNKVQEKATEDAN